jgi:hypothetical protein
MKAEYDFSNAKKNPYAKGLKEDVARESLTAGQSDADDFVVRDGLTYFRVSILATDATTAIWIGDDHGHLVVRETGAIDTHLLPGDYTVEFGLGSTTYPLELRGPVVLTEAAVRAGPSCARPEFRFYE